MPGFASPRVTKFENASPDGVDELAPGITVHHVGGTYNLAYDVEPYTSTVTRHWFLDEAAKNNWLLVLDHEPGNPLQRVRPDGKGWYQLAPRPAD